MSGGAAVRPAEGAILLACATTAMPADRVELLRRLAGGPVDWELVVRLAAKHRLLPLLVRTLSAWCPDAIPGETLRSLASRVNANAARSAELFRETVRLCGSIEAAGVAVVVLKGVPLAAAAYGDSTLRQSWDIDLLVAEADVPTVVAILAGEGYVPGKAFDRARDFSHPTRKVSVDLHWALTPLFFPVDVDLGGLLARRRWPVIDEVPLPVPCAEDMLCILCVQVAKDCWERRQHLEYLSKVTDIAEFLRATPDLDWPRVAGDARAQGWSRALHFGLALAGDLLGAEIPAGMLDDVRADRVAQRLAEDVCRRLFTPEDLAGFRLATAPFTLRHRLRQLRFYLAMRERPVDWA